MDIGNAENADLPSDYQSGEDEECDEDDEDIDLKRAKEAQRERPICLANMNDIKSKFETGNSQSREERREERKQEIQSIRSRLFMGKQARIKEMYQQAVADSEQCMYHVHFKFFENLKVFTCFSFVFEASLLSSVPPAAISFFLDNFYA